MIMKWLKPALACLGVAVGTATAQVADNPLSAVGPGWYQPFSALTPEGADPFLGSFSATPSPALPASYAFFDRVHIQMHFAARGEYWAADSTRWGIGGRPTNLAVAWPLVKSGRLALYALMQPMAKAGHAWLDNGSDGEYPVTWARIHRGSLQRVEGGLAWRFLPFLAVAVSPAYVWGAYQSQSEMHYPDSVTDHYMTVVVDRLRMRRWTWKASLIFSKETSNGMRHDAAIYYSPSVTLLAEGSHQYGVDLSRKSEPIQMHADSITGRIPFPSHYGAAYAIEWKKYRLVGSFETSDSFVTTGLFRFGDWQGAFQRANVGFQWRPFRPLISALYDFRHSVGVYALRQPFGYLGKQVTERGMSIGTSFRTSASPSRITLGVHIGRIEPAGAKPHWTAHIQLGINIADKWFERPYWD